MKNWNKLPLPMMMLLCNTGEVLKILKNRLKRNEKKEKISSEIWMKKKRKNFSYVSLLFELTCFFKYFISHLLIEIKIK